MKGRDLRELAKDALKEGSELLRTLLGLDVEGADKHLENMKAMGKEEFSRAAEGVVSSLVEGFWGDSGPPPGPKCPDCSQGVGWAAGTFGVWVGLCGCQLTCWRWCSANPVIATRARADRAELPRSYEHREFPLPRIADDGRTIDTKFETGPAKEA